MSYSKHTIAMLPGDGIGPEVMKAAEKVLHKIGRAVEMEFECAEYPIGGAAIDTEGMPLSEETIKGCKSSEAVLLGAVGGPKWENLPQAQRPEAGLLKIRKELGLYINIRPALVYESFLDASSLKNDVLRGTDFVVFRELTGGIYFGEPRGINEGEAWNTMRYSREEVKRIAVKAFEAARMRKKSVVSVDKANVLEVSQFWRNCVAEVHKSFPDVELTNMYVDNAAMQIVRNPRQFDLILTSNMFGDILTDIAGMITGSLGMLPSASIGEKFALYEPAHGSAPDIAGKNIANPIAMISSLAMMFEHTYKLPMMAYKINRAIENTLRKGYRTRDIWSEGYIMLHTDEMADIITYEFEHDVY